MTPVRHRVDALFRSHGADVLAYALRRCDDAATAEDVVAEVFLVVWRRADRIPASDPVLWLYAVARRVLANQRRAARRREALIGVLRPLTRRSVSAPTVSSGLVDALGRLKPADREVLMLTAWEGLDAAQVAAVLGVSPAAVHTRLHRARARLHAELAVERSPAELPLS